MHIEIIKIMYYKSARAWRRTVPEYRVFADGKLVDRFQKYRNAQAAVRNLKAREKNLAEKFVATERHPAGHRPDTGN